MKRFFDTELWSWIAEILECLMIGAVILAVYVLLMRIL